MVFNITLTDEDWLIQKLQGNNVLDFNATFVDYLMGFTQGKIKNVDQVHIRLPLIVNKQERYCIHKMSYNFSAVSYDNADGDRFMIIRFDKSFVKEYLETHQNLLQGIQEENETPDHFTVEINNEHVIVEIDEEVVLKSDKQHLFDIMVHFIESNLPDQLNEYIAKNFKITKV